MTNIELKKWASDHSWAKSMSNRNSLDSYDNYIGPDMGSQVVVIGRNRDSDLRDDSNFDAALEMLGGEGKHVEIHRFGHWACGWFELILVNPKSLKHVKIAYEIKRLLEQYPVLDDSDYSDREHEQFSEFSENEKDGLAESIAEYFKINLTDDLIELAFELNMHEQQYNGSDSCIHLSRYPSDYELRNLKSALEYINRDLTQVELCTQLLSKL